MNQTNLRRPARMLLLLSVVLFLVFIGLALYHKFVTRLQVATNQDLQEELQAATLFDEVEVPSERTDWPQWRGIRRDGIAFEPHLLTQWPADGPKELWQTEGGAGFSSFAVRDGRCYTMLHRDGRERIVCYDTANGKEQFSYDYDVRYSSSPGGSGPRSTPCLDGDRLYTVGVTGILNCLDVHTGKPAWAQAHDLVKEYGAAIPQWGVAFSPLIEGDLVITTPGGPNGHAIVAFNKETGAEAWHCLDDKAGYSSPVVLTAGGVRQIVAFLGDRVVGVSAKDGAFLWSFTWTTFSDVNAATPLVFKARSGDRILDYVFISSGYSKGCALLKIAPTPGGGFEVQPVYVGNQLCSHFASPVRRSEYLYGFNEAKLVCLEIKTGKIKWSQGGFQKGSLLGVGEHLIVLGERGELALFAATPTEAKQLATTSPFSRRPRQAWTMPVLAEGKLFLRDEDNVVCLEMREN